MGIQCSRASQGYLEAMMESFVSMLETHELVEFSVVLESSVLALSITVS